MATRRSVRATAVAVALGVLLTTTSGGAVVCAPKGDVGPSPGAHSGEWLTSVMLALRPDLVRLESADSELAVELRMATPERGARHVQRFVASIVDDARRRGLLG